ncbi:UDP-glucose/GDP-mannose dehydrogenase family protein [Opitutales bacterium ASA1]|uniref:UDP-glucose dehydrogenase family protein n=1 Tax=Congregicoccus parvus TaxID=3081749 RepID=UPI002B2AF2E3|nr:UDP-glucose/GDP-mannose dehydrogenase family protein [Opitutales bacterium ASA1]
MKVSVIGTGYVGLVSGVCLADKGHEVVCVDIDPKKVDRINRADPPIHERGLDELLEKNIGTHLRATTDLATAVRESDLSLIAVGTPFKGDEIDLRYIRQAAADIGNALRGKNGYHVVIVKSTVVPGTTENVVLPELERASGKKAGVDFGVGMNPEFLREGEAIEDFMSPDRIVLGGIDERTTDVLAELYSVFQDVPKIRTSPRTAEMIKYTANSLLATMISFSNEIGNLAASLGGIDVVEVMRGVHLDKRLTPILADGRRVVPGFTTYLEAGCGFGGSCFPKDVKALIAHGEKAGSPMRLLAQVVQVNERQPARVIELIKKHHASLDGLSVAVLGVAFKPGTDDIRESPALPVLETLLAEGAKVTVFDPIAVEPLQAAYPSQPIRYAEKLTDATTSADVIVLMTRWPEFKELPSLLSGRDPQPLVVDGRRMLDKASVARYEGIGLTPVA